jgi:mannose-6-phosphate isomerase-like protein (cupin superfamily)
MITIIDTAARQSAPIPEGSVRQILTPSSDKTMVEVARYEVAAGRTHRVAPSERTQVVYVMEGNGAEVIFTKAGNATVHTANRRSGVYLEPGEEAVIKASGAASGTPLVLLQVTVPKHTGKPIAPGAPPTGYFFEESKLQALVDEKRIRTRTFWVNKETGLSGSWDLQIGRMLYGPEAYSPRHVHNASRTSSITPEHFYLIETGTGEVKHDSGSLPVGPGSLVFIPAGEWHQLVASSSGFDYIEFQAPFDFATTMDHDPQGKNWYIQGTDDGTGNPKLWVQS